MMDETDPDPDVAAAAGNATLGLTAQTPRGRTTLDAIFRYEALQDAKKEREAKKEKSFAPMLAATCEDIATLKYPVLVSPKLDGIRCLIRGGKAVSRNLKPIPNKYIQEKLKGLPDGLDGELIVGPAVGDDVWNRSQSGVMSKDGEPDFTYWVFDKCAGCLPDFFDIRFQGARMDVREAQLKGNKYIDLVEHQSVVSAVGLAAVEQVWVEQGFEGLMIRDPNGKYKFGRSTDKEGGLLKLKRWHDAEAVVVDMVERQHNGNEATTDALGRTKRTTHKANKTGRGDMGALVCEWCSGEVGFSKTRFELGTGFTDEQRADLWKNSPIGRVVTFKYQSLSPDGVPRFPVWKGFRHPGDITTEFSK